MIHRHFIAGVTALAIGITGFAAIPAQASVSTTRADNLVVIGDVIAAVQSGDQDTTQLEAQTVSFKKKFKKARKFKKGHGKHHAKKHHHKGYAYKSKRHHKKYKRYGHRRSSYRDLYWK